MKNLKKNLVSKIHIISIAIVFIFASCKKTRDSVHEYINKPACISVSIDLPSMIKVSDTLNGLVVYKSDYTNIKLKKGERRYVYLYLANTASPLKNYAELKNIERDTFTLIYDSIIPIYDIKFKKKGEIRLEGYIIEEIYLMDTINDEFIKNTLETKISHPIMVK